MWPYFGYDLENAQHFTTVFEILSELPVRRSVDDQINIFFKSVQKCFNLRYNLDHLSLIFLFRIMTVRDVKMFLAVSHDSSTDKQKRGISPISHFTLSDKRIKAKNSNHYLPNETRKKFLTFCHFPDLLIEFCEKEWIETLKLHSMM